MKQVNLGVVRDILTSLPDVEESTIHGSPSFKLGGKLLACPAIHKSAEPDSLLVRVPGAERDRLLAGEPRRYYVTDHYLRNPVVLVRLAEIDRKALYSLLERAWQVLRQSRSDARSTRPVPAPRRASRQSPASRLARSRTKTRAPA